MVRVLVVDDSAITRDILTRGLSFDPEIEVVGTAADPFEARDKILQLHPDVLTLDVEMPRMNGLKFLKKLIPQYPIPVVMVSALTDQGSKITLDALAAGAVDFVLKPKGVTGTELLHMLAELRRKVKMAARVDLSHWKHKNGISAFKARPCTSFPNRSDIIIAIGASTGGTEAVKRVVTPLPPDAPGIVVVQHMPAGFTKMYANRLNELAAMQVKEAQTGDVIRNGLVLIAPGDFHMRVIRSGKEYRVICEKTNLVNGHRPSVEVLFRSVARNVGKKAIGIMLTGMGADGADAMVEMRQAGARTVAQDESTSVVFGMPKEAFKRGGAEKLAPIDRIPAIIKEYLMVMN